MSRIKVLIVDDNFVARRGLRSFLESENDFEIVGEASSGNHAVKFVKEVETDAVLMDIRMPDTDGIHATIQDSEPKTKNTKYIMLTVLEDSSNYP
jgi:YesN/AraC family two-component response regulator